MYAKQIWPLLVQSLQLAQAGDGTGFRLLSDFAYARNDDGTFDPGGDRYFLITAADQKYERGIKQYLDAGNESWGLFDHSWWNTGYSELNYGLYDPHSNGVYDGPFRTSRSAPTALEVATTYDPATPYKGALRTEATLGNVRLLTMRGDGHTAYGGNSACIDDAVNAYIETLALPDGGHRLPAGGAVRLGSREDDGSVASQDRAAPRASLARRIALSLEEGRPAETPGDPPLRSS